MTDTEKLQKEIQGGLFREAALKRHLDYMVVESRKLQLILEHAKEYYKNGKLYEFINNGFISYELFETPNGTAVYFADIFVKRSARNGGTLEEIINFCKTLEDKHDITEGYCRVEKTNPHIRTLKSMYAMVGFKYYKEDDDALYYKWLKP